MPLRNERKKSRKRRIRKSSKRAKGILLNAKRRHCALGKEKGSVTTEAGMVEAIDVSK